MNILVISHMFPSKIRPNDGTFVLQQIEVLKAMGHNVLVVCPTPWLPKWLPVKLAKWQIYQDLPQSETLSGIKVYFKRGFVIPSGSDWTRGTLFYLYNWFFFKKLFRQYQFDIIHSHTVLPDGDIGLNLKRKYKTPLITTIHGADLYYMAPSSKINKSRMFKILHNSNGIGLVSKDLKYTLESLYRLPDNFPPYRVIYNGIKIYDKYDKPDWLGFDDTFKILSISSLIERKNLITVFHALADLTQIYNHLKYYIIGDGWHRELILKKIKELDLDDVVHLLGPMPHNKAMSYLKESDLFVLPSYNESWGVVYIESMYLGKVTVASEGEGISELIEHGVNGYLVNPKDYHSVKEIIEKVLIEKSISKTIGKKAHEDVWPRFSWLKNAQEYLLLYQKANKDVV